jgi:hypothetical protein
MPALPHRYHGGDRLHRAAQSLPAGARYIMIQDRHSNRMKSNCLPDRDGNVWAATTTGARTLGPKGQILAVMTARRFDCLGPYPQAGPTPACSVARKAPLRHRQSSRPHSMPIGLMAGGAGAESARGISPRAAHRSGLDTLASSGSCHRTKAAAFRRELELILLPVGSLPTPMTCSLCSAGITPLHHYYGAVRP